MRSGRRIGKGIAARRMAVGAAAFMAIILPVVAGITNSAPYQKTFEQSEDAAYTNGYSLPVDGTNGWYAAEPDALVIEADSYTYSGTPGYPLPGTHDQVLKVNSDATNLVTTPANQEAWVDKMLQPVFWDETNPPAIPSDTQIAYYVNTNGQFVVFSQTNSLGSSGWATIPSPTVSSGDWVRVTLDLNYDPASIDFEFFALTCRVLVDGTALVNPASSTGSTAFAIAQASATQMNMLSISGTAKLDDLQVVTNDPLQAAYITLNVSANAGGTVVPQGDTVLTSGASTSVVVTADTGYIIQEILKNTVAVTITNTSAMTLDLPNITSNETIAVTFALSSPSTYDIVATAGANGSITPSGTVQVNAGTNQTFTMTPSNYYGVSSVMVDSTNMGALSSYTFTNVMATHTIHVDFTALYTSNGVPHWWIGQFGITPSDQQAATNDVDMDGVVLGDEYLASTDPSDGNSYFQMAESWESMGTNYFRWYSPYIDPGLPPFGILANTNLTASNGWVLVDASVTRSGTNVWTYTPGTSFPAGVPVFFRVVATNAP